MVDQECIALAGAGHRVERFEKFSDDIVHFSGPRKALLPAQALWSTSSARALRHVVEAFKPDVVHVHNLFPLLSPSVMQVCRRRQIPVVATIHNYTLICSSGTLFRSGAICRECVGRHPLPAIRHRCYQGSALATGLRATAAVAHQHAWRTVPSAYIFISEAQQAEFASLGLPRDRCFVKGNFVVPGPPKQATEDSARIPRAHERREGTPTADGGLGFSMRGTSTVPGCGWCSRDLVGSTRSFVPGRRRALPSSSSAYRPKTSARRCSAGRERRSSLQSGPRPSG